jgi:hypothetical protein
LLDGKVVSQVPGHLLDAAIRDAHKARIEAVMTYAVGHDMHLGVDPY